MDKPNYLTSEEIGDEYDASDGGSEISENSDADYVPLYDSFDDDDSDSESENEEMELASSNENVDPLFVSKDGIVWNPQPFQSQAGRS